MRRILFPLLVIGLAAGLFTLGSGAFFSDVESDTGNTITAGTLDLANPGTQAATTTCTKSGYSPTTGGTVIFDDASDHCESQVKNIGSLDGDLWLQIDVVGTGCVGTSEFCDGVSNLNTQLTANTCSEPVSGGTALAGGPPNPCDSLTTAQSVEMTCVLVATLPANGTYAVTFKLGDAGVTNASQGDSVEFKFYYQLVQTGQGGTCPPTD